MSSRIYTDRRSGGVGSLLLTLVIAASITIALEGTAVSLSADSDDLTDLEDRIRVQDAAIAISDYLDSLPAEENAGLLLDHRAEGTVPVAHVTTSASQHEAAIRDLYEGAFEVRQVDHSLEDLKQTAKQVWSEWTNDVSLGGDLVASRVSIRENAVLFELTGDVSADAVMAIEGTGVGARVADELHIRDVANRSFDGPPMEGGLEIISITGSLACSNAFSAFHDEPIGPPGAGAFIRHHFVMTAGHCVVHAGADWEHLGGWISTSVDHQWGGRLDAALLQATGLDTSTQIYLTSTNKRQVVGAQAPGQDAEGQLVCHSGITTLNQCGFITTVSASGQINGVQFHDFREYDAPCDHGDSGGPVYRPSGANATAMGIVSYLIAHWWTGEIVGCGFGHIHYAANELGVSVLTVHD